MSQRFSTTLWLIVAIVGMGFMQWLTRSAEVRLPPGPERGDIRVQQSVLDSDIDGWKQIKFTPAENAEELPDGQFWWSFTWHYQKDDLVAVVAFDQADWHDWHELTVCYRAIGWELMSRSTRLQENPRKMANIATATLRKEHVREYAMLVFSEFDQNGELLTAPERSMIPTDEQPTATFLQNLQNRVDDQPQDHIKSADQHKLTKVLQVQVFLPHQRDLTEAERQSLLMLHSRCVSNFQSEWLRQKNAR